MTLNAAATRAAAPRSYRIGRGTFLAASLAAIAAGAGLAQLSPGPAIADTGLIRVLQFMAVLKFAGAAIAAWLIDWRLRAGISPRLAAGYVAGIAMMLVASAMIALLANVIVAALLYHIGLLLALLLAWQDGPARK
jgi:hypothetical protein